MHDKHMDDDFMSTNPAHWIELFKKDMIDCCVEHKWTTLAHSLCMMGCDDPSHVDPHDPEFIVEVFGSVEDFRRFNRRVHGMIKTHACIKPLRRVVLRDLHTSVDYMEGNDYGRIFLKSYARRLLDSFLVENLDPAW